MAELTLIVLSQEAYRERMVRWEVLSQAYGYTGAYARRRRQTDIPDVFDQLLARVQEPVRGSTLLVDDYTIERRFSLSGQDYPLFFHISHWFRFLKNYLPPACAIDPDVFAFLCRSGSHFRDTAHSAIVLFKLLYRFAQLEGLPVRQKWLERREDREQLQAILHRPLADLGIRPTSPAPEPPCDLLPRLSQLESVLPQLSEWILQASGHGAAASSTDG